MSKNAKTLIGWVVMLSVLGGVGYYLWDGKSKPAPTPQPEKPHWTLDKYDSGKFYFTEDFITEFRAVCESADCTPLLDHVQVGLLGALNDVKQDGLHLTVKHDGAEYHFKVEAMGRSILRDGSIEKGSAQGGSD